MFAVVQTGGKQYKVTQGDVLQVEKLDAEAGTVVDLPVMMLGGDSVQVGKPFIEGATVKAEVLGEVKGEKISMMRYKAKNNSRVRKGHRQKFTQIKIVSV